MLVDVHAHLNINAFENDYHETINRAREQNIWLINIGIDLKSSQRAIEIAEEYENGVYASVGIHPNSLENNFDENREKLLTLAKNKKVVAIGECGLDYHYVIASAAKQSQQELFIKHIELAKEVKKPLMIHCREAPQENNLPMGQAFADLIKILQSVSCHSRPAGEQVPQESKLLTGQTPYGVNSGGNPTFCHSRESGNPALSNFILHFFTGSLSNAKKLLTMGGYFTFGGLITFNRDFDEIIKFLPLNRILLETDAPFVAPALHRGQRNEPSFLPEIAQKIAEIKGVSFKEVCDQTTKNVKNIFALK